MKYRIDITMETETHGTLVFVDGPVGINSTCYYADTTPVTRGETYTGAATRMETKKDSVTGLKRPGIFFKEFGTRGIFIHEGVDVSWSENCIVLNRNDMMKMWDHIVNQGDKEKFVVEIVVK